LNDIEETKKDFHTVQVKVQYNKPLYFDQEVEVGTKIKEIGNTSMTWIMGMFLIETGELVSSCEAGSRIYRSNNNETNTNNRRP
jgi:acyl-CoA thioesterase FadM